LAKLILFLILIIAGLQYRLWLGDGGIKEYRETLGRIDDLRTEGENRRARNAAIAADVADLRDGTDAIEERARHDLGLVKPGETFVQVYEEVDDTSPTPKGDATVKPVAPKSKQKSKSKPKSVVPDKGISPPLTGEPH
jgi:cell division protein FtsB